MNPLLRVYSFSPNSNDGASFKTVNSALLAVAAAVLLSAGPAQAGNLLVNPDFETPPLNAQVVATSWTYFAPPTLGAGVKDYWVANQGSGNGMIPESGTYFWKQWGALYAAPPVNNVAGIYQTFSSAPGAIYQASGWLSTSASDVLGVDNVTWIEVSFLGAGSNVLALYKSPDFSASVGTSTWFQYQVASACDLSQPVSTGDPYFTTYAVTGSVSQLVAPLGTTAVRYRYAFLQVGREGGSAFLDDAVLDQISGPIPPVITSLFPANMIFVNPADGISFTVSSPSGFTINNNAIGLVLNGVDVSSSLAISGSSSNKNVSYHGLQSNMVYTASITVTDAFNLTVSRSTYFETMWAGIQPITYLWEAEDFDFTNGLYFNQPVLCNTIGSPNCYFGTVGVEGGDEHSSGSAATPACR